MNAFFTTAELLSLFVISNRIMALARPFRYKIANHIKNQIFAAVFCLTISFSTSVFHYFLFKVVYLDEHSGLYTFTSDNVYENSLIYVILNQTRNAVRGISLMIMCIGNIFLVWLYRKHRLNYKVNFNQSNDKEKEETERTLTVLCLCQSFFATLSSTTLITFYAYLAINPPMYTCEGILLILLVNGIIELTEICDFYFACLINKKF